MNKFIITTFVDQAAKKKTELTETLETLRDAILAKEAPTKQDLPWLKMARFGDDKTRNGSVRHNANLLEITGIEGDYDGKALSVDDAIALLKAAGILAMVYTSPSHTADAPKWRVLCPVSTPLPGTRHSDLVARLNGVLGGVLDGASFTLSQAYYYGRAANNPTPDHRVEIVEGGFIDLLDHLDAGKIGKSDKKARGTKNNKASGKKDAGSKVKIGRHEMTAKIAGTYALQGKPEDTAVEAVREELEKTPSEDRDAVWKERWDDVPRTVGDIYAKEEAKPVEWADADRETKLAWCKKHATSVRRATCDDKLAEELVKITDRYALIVIGGVDRVIDLHRLDRIETLQSRAFNALFKNRRYTVCDEKGEPTKRMVTLAGLWETFPKRRTYTQVVFMPPTKGYEPYVATHQYNSFVGFETTPKQGAYPKFKAHLREHVCQNDPERFKFLMMWFADIIQSPGRKTGSAVFLKGDEGAGKSIVGEEFIKVIGERHSFGAGIEDQVVGKFNSHLALTLFCQVEEAMFAGSKTFRTFKDMVVREKMPMEMKGVDIITVPNFTRYLTTTNEKWVVPATSDSRRWFVMEVALPKEWDQAKKAMHFAEIREEMDQGGREAWLYDLMQVEIDETLLRKPPNTWELEQQRMQTLTTEQQFWIDVLDENAPNMFPQAYDDIDYPKATELHDHFYPRFEEYMLKRSARFKANTTVFRSSLQEMLLTGEPSQKKVKGENARRYAVRSAVRIKQILMVEKKLSPALLGIDVADSGDKEEK